MCNPFKKKDKSLLLPPDWSDEDLLKALGEDGGTFIEVLKRAPELRRDIIRQAISIKYQRKTARVTLCVGIGAIIASLIIAIGVPIYQQQQQIQSELSALYRTLDTNGNIFVNNFNNMRSFETSDIIANLPDEYIGYTIPNDLYQPLQQQLGMVNYTFLLYYTEETDFLNETRSELNTSLITNGANSPEYKNEKTIYVATMNYLAASGWNQTKFNYQMDTGCLMFLLKRGFSSIPTSKFDQSIACSTDSLNRIYYWFGYLPPLTPTWMQPLLRNALNQRQAGLGDQNVQNIKTGN